MQSAAPKSRSAHRVSRRAIWLRWVQVSAALPLGALARVTWCWVELSASSRAVDYLLAIEVSAVQARSGRGDAEVPEGRAKNSVEQPRRWSLGDDEAHHVLVGAGGVGWRR